MGVRIPRNAHRLWDLPKLLHVPCSVSGLSATALGDARLRDADPVDPARRRRSPRVRSTAQRFEGTTGRCVGFSFNQQHPPCDRTFTRHRCCRVDGTSDASRAITARRYFGRDIRHASVRRDRITHNTGGLRNCGRFASISLLGCVGYDIGKSIADKTCVLSCCVCDSGGLFLGRIQYALVSATGRIWSRQSWTSRIRHPAPVAWTNGPLPARRHPLPFSGTHLVCCRILPKARRSPSKAARGWRSCLERSGSCDHWNPRMVRGRRQG